MIQIINPLDKVPTDLDSEAMKLTCSCNCVTTMLKFGAVTVGVTNAQFQQQGGCGCGCYEDINQSREGTFNAGYYGYEN